MRGIKGLWGFRPRKPAEFRLYTASDVWIKQADLVYIEVEIQAAGGAGLYDGATPNANGGGSGAYSRRVIRAADLAAQEIVTIGATTSFGGWVSCTAGAAAISGTGGAGGIATGGDTNVNGEAGVTTLGNTAWGGRSVLGYFGSGGMASGSTANQPGGPGCVRIREVYVR